MKGEKILIASEPIAGMAPVAAQTLAMTLVNLELLEKVIDQMPRQEFGVRLFVEVDYDECSKPLLRAPRLEKRTVEVEFGPIDPASDEALTAMTFNPIILDPLFKMPLLQSTVDQLEKLRNSRDELAKAGLTLKDVDDRLKQTHDQIARLQGTNQQFQQRYQDKVYGLAAKASR
jgi:hypothetical protein